MFDAQCLILCKKCTMHQFIDWKAKLWFTKYQQSFLVALPGLLQNVTLRSTSTQNIHVTWMDREMLSNRVTKLLKPVFPRNSKYKMYSYLYQTRKGTYYFVKYMDYRYNQLYRDEMYFHFDRSLRIKRKSTYPKIRCTHEKQKPKSFSWEEASQTCQNINANLPEFYSRKDQEDFINILKSEDIFPIEAVFIGLRYDEAVSYI